MVVVAVVVVDVVVVVVMFAGVGQARSAVGRDQHLGQPSHQTSAQTRLAARPGQHQESIIDFPEVYISLLFKFTDHSM